MNGSPRRPLDTTKCAAEGDALAPLTALARSFADLVLGEGSSPVQPASRIGNPPSAGTSGGEEALRAPSEATGEVAEG